MYAGIRPLGHFVAVADAVTVAVGIVGAAAHVAGITEPERAVADFAHVRNAVAVAVGVAIRIQPFEFPAREGAGLAEAVLVRSDHDLTRTVLRKAAGTGRVLPDGNRSGLIREWLGEVWFRADEDGKVRTRLQESVQARVRGPDQATALHEQMAVTVE